MNKVKEYLTLKKFKETTCSTCDERIENCCLKRNEEKIVFRYLENPRVYPSFKHKHTRILNGKSCIYFVAKENK